MSLSVIRPSLGADDCPSGMVDDGDGGCVPWVPPTGGLNPSNPNYVPPTGGLVDYRVTDPNIGPPEQQPTSAGMALLTAIVLAPFFI